MQEQDLDIGCSGGNGGSSGAYSEHVADAGKEDGRTRRIIKCLDDAVGIVEGTETAVQGEGDGVIVKGNGNGEEVRRQMGMGEAESHKEVEEEENEEEEEEEKKRKNEKKIRDVSTLFLSQSSPMASETPTFPTMTLRTAVCTNSAPNDDTETENGSTCAMIAKETMRTTKVTTTTTKTETTESATKDESVAGTSSMTAMAGTGPFRPCQMCSVSVGSDDDDEDDNSDDDEKGLAKGKAKAAKGGTWHGGNGNNSTLQSRITSSTTHARPHSHSRSRSGATSTAMAIYQCPRCHIRTCSLQCCRNHKLQNNCTGKRDRVGFFPLGQFDDSRLVSDYHFLEDVLRAKDGTRRFAASAMMMTTTTTMGNGKNGGGKRTSAKSRQGCNGKAAAVGRDDRREGESNVVATLVPSLLQAAAEKTATGVEKDEETRMNARAGAEALAETGPGKYATFPADHDDDDDDESNQKKQSDRVRRRNENGNNDDESCKHINNINVNDASYKRRRIACDGDMDASSFPASLSTPLFAVASSSLPLPLSTTNQKGTMKSGDVAGRGMDGRRCATDTCTGNGNGGALDRLVSEARMRNVRLLLMPRGMGRRLANTTLYRMKTDEILWKVDWAFHRVWYRRRRHSGGNNNDDKKEEDGGNKGLDGTGVDIDADDHDNDEKKEDTAGKKGVGKNVKTITSKVEIRKETLAVIPADRIPESTVLSSALSRLLPQARRHDNDGENENDGNGNGGGGKQKKKKTTTTTEKAGLFSEEKNVGRLLSSSSSSSLSNNLRLLLPRDVRTALYAYCRSHSIRSKDRRRLRRLQQRRNGRDEDEDKEGEIERKGQENGERDEEKCRRESNGLVTKGKNETETKSMALATMETKETTKSNIRLLIKDLPCPASRPRYVELDPESTLADALIGRTVIEYPTIEVVLEEEDKEAGAEAEAASCGRVKKYSTVPMMMNGGCSSSFPRLVEEISSSSSSA